MSFSTFLGASHNTYLPLAAGAEFWKDERRRKWQCRWKGAAFVLLGLGLGRGASPEEGAALVLFNIRVQGGASAQGCWARRGAAMLALVYCAT
eukprot:COSAG06_NODE_44397_length_363_cov_4.700758_1_plen_92_part_10